MEKTGQMIEFEEETGQSAIVTVKVGFAELQFPSEAYVQWVEYELLKHSVKAAAYGRRMSGGKKTLKEWANFLGKCFAVDPDGFGYSFGSKPIIKDEHWWPDGDRIAYSAIRPDLIDFNGDWKDSLTLPDGWEESK